MEENVKKKGESKSTKFYDMFNETYSKVGAVEMNQLDRTFITMTDYAKLYHITRQAVHQLFRRGEIRGVKVSRPEWKRVRVYLDPKSAPSYSKTPWKLLAARKAALKSADAQRDAGGTLEA